MSIPMSESVFKALLDAGVLSDADGDRPIRKMVVIMEVGEPVIVIEERYGDKDECRVLCNALGENSVRVVKVEDHDS